MKTAQAILANINESKRVVAISEGAARPYFVRFDSVAKDPMLRTAGFALLGDFGIKQIEATDDPLVYYAYVEDPSVLPDVNGTLSYMKVEAR